MANEIVTKLIIDADPQQTIAAINNIQKGFNKLDVTQNMRSNFNTMAENFKQAWEKIEEYANKKEIGASQRKDFEKTTDQIVELWTKMNQVLSKEGLASKPLREYAKAFEGLIKISNEYDKELRNEVELSKNIKDAEQSVKDVTAEGNKLLKEKNRLLDKQAKIQEAIDAKEKANKRVEEAERKKSITEGKLSKLSAVDPAALKAQQKKAEDAMNRWYNGGKESKADKKRYETYKQETAELHKLEKQQKDYETETARLKTREEELTAAKNKAVQVNAQYQGSLNSFQGRLKGVRDDLDKVDKKIADNSQGLINANNAVDQAKQNFSEFAQNVLQRLINGFNETHEASEKINWEKVGINPTQIHNADDLKVALERLKNEGLIETDKEFERIRTELNQISPAVDEAKDKTSQLTDTFTELTDKQKDIESLINRVKHFFSLSSGAMLFRRVLRQTIQTITELDKVMTQTAVVTSMTVGDMWKMLPEYTKRANELGVAIKDVYEADTLYYQQGLKTNEVMAVSNETMKMARIAGLDAAEATDRMTNALRGFNMEITTANAQNINDVYSNLAAHTASNVQEISVAMTKVASLASNANMSFENTAAFLSQIIETTRESAETAGTALKTVIARFSEVKTLYSKGELMGQDEEGQEIDVNRIGGALRTAGIDLNEYMTGAKGLDEIFMELASKWDSLDMVQQRYIATMAAGSRQQSRFIALMQDYNRMTELTTMANNSAGASQEQFNKTLESLETLTNRLKNAWDEFLLGLLNTDAVKAIIKILTSLLDTINKLTNGWDNMSKSFLKAFAAIGAFKIGGAIFKGLSNSIINAFRGTGKKAGTSFIKALLPTIQNSKTITKKLDLSIPKENLVSWRALRSERDLTIYQDGELSMGARILSTEYNQLTSDYIQQISALTGLNSEKAEELALSLEEKIATGQLNQEVLIGIGILNKDLALKYLQALANGASASSLFKLAHAQAVENALTQGGIAGLLTSIGLAIAHKAAKTGEEVVTWQNVKAKIAEAIAQNVLNIYMLIALGIIILIVAAIIGLIALLTALTKAEYKASKAGQLEAAAEAAKNLQEASDSAKESVDNLKQALDDYSNYQNTLDDLTVGTLEWRNALYEANQQVLDLVNKYPQLRDAMDPSGGRLTLDTSAVEKLLAEEQKRSIILSNSLAQQNLEVARLQNEVKLENVQKNDNWVQSDAWDQVLKNAVSALGGPIGTAIWAAVESEDDKEDALISQIQKEIDNNDWTQNADLLHDLATNPEYTKVWEKYSTDFENYAKDRQQWEIQCAAQLTAANQSLAAMITDDTTEAQYLALVGEQLNVRDEASAAMLQLRYGGNNGEKDVKRKYAELHGYSYNESNDKLTNAEGQEVKWKDIYESAYTEVENAVLEETRAKALEKVDTTEFNKLNKTEQEAVLAVMTGKATYTQVQMVETNKHLKGIATQAQNLNETEFSTDKYTYKQRTYYDPDTGREVITGYDLYDKEGNALAKNISTKDYELFKQNGYTNEDNTLSEAYQAIAEFIDNGLSGYEQQWGSLRLTKGTNNKIEKNLIADAEDRNKKVTEAEVSGQIDSILSKIGEESTGAFVNLLSQDWEKNPPDFSGFLKTLNFDNISEFKDAKKALEEFADYIGVDFVNTLEISKADLQKEATIFQDLLYGDYDINAISEEDYKTWNLGEFGRQFFQQNADGTFTFLGSSQQELIDLLRELNLTGSQIVDKVTDESSSAEVIDYVKSGAAQKEQLDYIMANTADPEIIKATTNALVAQAKQYKDLTHEVASFNKGLIGEIELTNSLNEAIETQKLESNLKVWHEYVEQLDELEPSSEAWEDTLADLSTATTLDLDWLRENFDLFKSAVEGDVNSLLALQNRFAFEATLDTTDFVDGMLTVAAANKLTTDTFNELVNSGQFDVVVKEDYLESGATIFKYDSSGNVTQETLTDSQHVSYLTLKKKDQSKMQQAAVSAGTRNKKEETHNWLTGLDKYYNLTAAINEQLRKREKLEREYDRLLQRREGTMADIHKNMMNQQASLRREIDLQERLQEGRKEQLYNAANEKIQWGEGYSTYAAVGADKYAHWDEQNHQIVINWDAIHAITNEDLGGAVEDYISKLEEYADGWNETESTIEDMEDELYELNQRGKEQYLELEDRVIEALVKQRQLEIDELKNISDEMNEMNSDIISNIQESIEMERQIRDNTKKEEEISDLENRLEYLRRDTSGANQVAILETQEKLEDARQQYTDQLIDQTIDQMSKDNEKAQEQREKQIELMEQSLDWDRIHGEFNEESRRLILESMDENGSLNENSALYKLLTTTDSFKFLSEWKQFNWMSEMLEGWKEAMVGERSFNLEKAERDKAVAAEKIKDFDQNLTYKDGKWYGDDGKQYNLDYDTISRMYTASAISTGENIKTNEIEGTYKDPGSKVPDNEPEEDPGSPSVVAYQVIDPDTNKVLGTYKDEATAANVLYKKINTLRNNDAFETIHINASLIEKAIEDSKKTTSTRGLSAIWTPLSNKLGIMGQDKIMAAYNKYLTQQLPWLKGILVPKYALGGLNTTTGPAWLDGTTSKPEYVLNARDTQVYLTLTNLLNKLLSNSTSVSDGSTSGGDNYFNIDINVDEIGSDYDVDQLLDRIKTQIVEDASYRNVNAINLSR